jgi:hypothetical protein
MREQPNYTCMLKNLLKLYCIWTWDTLWVFFLCVQFCSTLSVPFDETTTEQHLRQHLQDWRLRWTPKLLKLKIHCIWTWRFFFFSFCFILFIYIYIFLSFTYFLFLFFSLFFFIFYIFYFYSSLYSFFLFSILCLSNACSAYYRLVH